MADAAQNLQSSLASAPSEESKVQAEPTYVAPRPVMEEAKNENEPGYIAPRPQVIDQLLDGDED